MAFTRDWDESQPTDKTNAVDIDDYNRYLRVDCSDRLKNMVYGFIAGENTLAQHFQYLQFYEQSSAPSTPAAGYLREYCKAVGGKCEKFWKDEDGDEAQLTTGGNIGGANLELAAGKDLLGSSTSDITINTDKFTVAGATGNTAIAGTCDITGATEVTGVATLGDASLLKTSAAPTTDAMIANKKYVDDSFPDDDAFGTRTGNDETPAALAINTVYKVTSDGFVTFNVQMSNQGDVFFYSDSSSPPTTELAEIHGDWGAGDIPCCVPVKKNEYWKITYAGAGTVDLIKWLPIGSGVCQDQT